MSHSSGGEYVEKRRAERKHLVFYLRVFDGTAGEALGHIVNLSSDGLMLFNDRSLPVNKDFRLRIRLPNMVGELRELMLDATSRWSKKDVDPDLFLTGFQLHNLENSDRKDILDLLEKLSYRD
jgi:hypothetical protein